MDSIEFFLVVWDMDLSNQGLFWRKRQIFPQNGTEKLKELYFQVHLPEDNHFQQINRVCQNNVDPKFSACFLYLAVIFPIRL